MEQSSFLFHNETPSTDKNIAISKEGYEFEIESESWRLSKDIVVRLKTLKSLLSSEFFTRCTKILVWYAEHQSAAYVNNIQIHLAHFFSNSKHLAYFAINDLINFRSSLSKEHLYKQTYIRVFINKGVELGYLDVEPSLVNMINEWKIPANPTGDAVRNRCPKEGPLTELELQSLFDGTKDAFADSEINLVEYCLLRLAIATGRRPSQLSDLKIIDLEKISTSGAGNVQYFLNIPRRKQRGSKWRDEFKRFALSKEMGSIIQTQIKSVLQRLKKISSINKKEYENFPIFPDWHKFGENSCDLSNDLLLSDFYHQSSGEISRVISTTANEKVSAYSERTQRRLSISPLRLRRTKGTLAGKEGYGVLAIAEILDHSDTTNAHVYTENGPETAEIIDKAMAAKLAPFAQAFSGLIVTDPKDSPRGNDPKSVIRSESSSQVGNCGHFGFCGAFAPLACYTCKRFNPWLEGPHEEVLQTLIDERERVLRDTGDTVIANANDRTIIAVTQVIEECRKIKRSIGGEVDE